jgi:hypothetical protein
LVWFCEVIDWSGGFERICSLWFEKKKR